MWFSCSICVFHSECLHRRWVALLCAFHNPMYAILRYNINIPHRRYLNVVACLLDTNTLARLNTSFLDSCLDEKTLRGSAMILTWLYAKTSMNIVLLFLEDAHDARAYTTISLSPQNLFDSVLFDYLGVKSALGYACGQSFSVFPSRFLGTSCIQQNSLSPLRR